LIAIALGPDPKFYENEAGAYGASAFFPASMTSFGNASR
jgi:hypothetical protein